MPRTDLTNRLISVRHVSFCLIFLLFCGLSGFCRDRQAPDATFLNVDVDSLARAIITEEGDGNIAGIWSATTSGATVAILPVRSWLKRTHQTIPGENFLLSTQWIVILVDSPSPKLQPGTIIGWFSPTARQSHFTGRLFTKQSRYKLKSPKDFTIQLHDDGHLAVKRIKKGLSLNPLRLLPYFFRSAIKYNDNTPDDLDGFIKVWPRPSNPLSPIYL